MREPWTTYEWSRTLRHISGEYQLVLECLTKRADQNAASILKEIDDTLNSRIQMQIRALRARNNDSIPPEGKGCFARH